MILPSLVCCRPVLRFPTPTCARSMSMPAYKRNTSNPTITPNLRAVNITKLQQQQLDNQDFLSPKRLIQSEERKKERKKEKEEKNKKKNEEKNQQAL